MHCLVFPGRRDNDTCQHLDIQNPSGFTDTRTHAKDLCEISKRFPQRRAKYKRPVKWAISTHYISETLEIGAQLLRSYALYQMVLLTMTQTDQRLPKHFSPTFCVAFHVFVIGGGYKTYHQLRINCFALYKYTHYYFFYTSGCSVLFLFLSRPRSEGWPHHGRTFSIYPCPLSF